MSRTPHSRLSWTVVVLTCVIGLPTACRKVVVPDTPPSRAALAELWVDAPAGRDLYYGVGGRRLMPRADETFKVIEIKTTGFSDGYTLVDERKQEWSAKFPPEAFTEVVASRILWGIGYHQPPIYLLDKWRASGGVEPNPQRPARFRQKKPDFYGLEDKGTWSYYEGPFVGTRPLNGLLVLQAMMGNSDLKDDQNAIYALSRPVEGASHWYVARDLGQTFGRTGVTDAPRGNIDAFEKTRFVEGVTNGHVQLDYHGRHETLFEKITVADVEWICRRLDRLSDRQWRDAFRAGGYDDELSARFIRRMKAKIAEGLALASTRKSV
jgi:hypothetical protein